MKTARHLLPAVILSVFGLTGLFLVVIRPLGPSWARLPGDLIDSRFNNYLLEHFFRWASGIETGYWNARFYYPFPDTMAFGDTLLGSGPIYALFRLLGLDRQSAFQGWYVTGYALNFLAAIYALRRWRFGAWAAAVAAFFFTFGLPVLAQDGHVQLLYRAGIPLACLFLWNFMVSPRLSAFLGVILCFVWQFFLSVYDGVFLALLLGAFLAVAPFLPGPRSLQILLRFWPGRAKTAWQAATPISRTLTSGAFILLAYAEAYLLSPYWQVRRMYRFERAWDVIASMLPTWRSYLVADRAWIWGTVSNLILGVPMRQEHQLFPGIATTLLAALGLAWLIFLGGDNRRQVAMLHLLAGSALAAVTFLFHGVTLYRILWALPGIDSIRAVTRIILVLMWPLTLLVAYGIDGLLGQKLRPSLLRAGSAAVLSALLVLESVLFQHATYDKSMAQARLARLRTQLPSMVPNHPVLIAANQPGDPWPVTELDAMLLGQDLGWAVLSGYSANFAPAYGPTLSCTEIPDRIIHYMHFAEILDASYYVDLIHRVVPLGFDDCDPSWWAQRPANSRGSGPLTREQVGGLQLRVIWIKTATDRTRVQIEIMNNSSKRIPAGSSSGNPFELAWRFSRNPGLLLGRGTAAQSQIEYDVRPRSTALVTLFVDPPAEAGTYWLEVAAAQKGITWPPAWPVPSAVSSQVVVIDAQGNVSTRPGASP